MTDQIDAIELLLRDHQMIRELAEQLDSTDDAGQIAALFGRIVDELAAHEAVEQEIVFPAFRAVVGADDDTTLEHRLGEHEELNEMLAEMRDLAPDCYGFTKRGSALLLEVTAHFSIEEESVFGRMRAAFSAEELAELGDRALAVKQRRGAESSAEANASPSDASDHEP